jgi:hypothetical protein
VYQQQQEQQQQEEQDAENPFLDPPFSRIKIEFFSPKMSNRGLFLNFEASGDQNDIAFDQVYQIVTSWCQGGHN